MVDSNIFKGLCAVTAFFGALALSQITFMQLIFVGALASTITYIEHTFEDWWNSLGPVAPKVVILSTVSILYFYFGIPLFVIFGSLLLAHVWILLDYAETVILTLPRDLKAAKLLIKLKLKIWKCLRENVPTAEIFVRDVVHRYPRKPAFVDAETGSIWTYSELNEFANQVANYFSEKGFKEGDTVALIMGNCPEYVGFWLGLSKIGVVSALINYNLKLDPLAHSINIVKTKGIIVAAEYCPGLEDSIDKKFVSNDLPVFVYGKSKSKSKNMENITKELENARDYTQIR